MGSCSAQFNVSQSEGWHFTRHFRQYQHAAGGATLRLGDGFCTADGSRNAYRFCHQFVDACFDFVG